MGVFLETTTDALAEIKREIELTKWADSILDELFEEYVPGDFNVAIRKVHPLGEIKLTDACKSNGWTDEDIANIIEKGKVDCSRTGEQCEMTLYEYEDSYTVLITADIRSFYIRPDDLSKDDILSMLDMAKKEKRMGFLGRMYTRMLLYFVKKEKS
ncbi:hypothetical protein [Bacillus toyonensis]|uniref:hypothetical protein n=1 Tax=Bacillus toyonensis TaxID=155322 RepID=UPI002E1C1BB2|nr:hypothetical protein [Bacillus toyonensis]